VERLRREARAASKISHPNVVDVTDSGTTPDGAFFFVMEYLEGVELGELIFKAGRLDVARAVNIGGQICRALQAAHSAGVIHRDLKPENVLILNSRDGQKDFVKVLDFGIAKSGTDSDHEDEKAADNKRRLTHPGMTMGTPEYMAPEQAAGRPADPRSDVYAAGGLLYEMLAGKPPYEGSNFMEILHKKANTQPAPLSAVRDDVPRALEELVMSTLAKDPAARPQSMEELGRKLLDVGGIAYPSIAKIDLDFFDAAPSTGKLAPAPAPAAPAAHSTSALLTRLAALEQKKVLIAAGGLVVLLVGFVAFGGSRRHKPAEAPPAPVAVAPPPAPVAPPEPVPVVAAEPAPSEEEAPEEAPEKPGANKKGANAKVTRVASAAETKRLLAEGERLLRAEKFPEARKAFEKASQSKKDRGPALVGLAEVAFQEKDYAQAAKSAAQAATAGGGVRARVLQGDAQFRLSHFKEAAQAYGDALKLDPGNAGAKSGLALANKRM
ncbi:MAG TPA: protein kinase, partial [Polyangia bacterium]|nr:protein kinase [Polyangia bacterium]